MLATVATVAAATVARADVPAAPPDVAVPGGGARRLASGVTVKTLARGHGRARPGAQDCVKVHYAGWRRDGTPVASAPAAAAPELQCLPHVIPGVAQALRSMTVGERRRVWVPARLSVRAGDDDDPPPAGQDLTYDVELVEIVAAPAPPSDLRAPPRDARRTSSGVAVQILRRGAGSHPMPGSQVTVHLAGWKTDGTLVESTRMGGHAAVFQVGDLLPGLRDGVLALAAGDRARLWIPAALAYGEHPRRRRQPAGPLVYEVDLLDVR